MCNAWNHSPECGCGFGGDGHLGGGNGGYRGYATLWLHAATGQFAPFPSCIRTLAQRYRQTITLPTHCRFCGADVYVYANEFGSFVIFDELGQPWPKHNCPNFPETIRSKIKEFDDYSLAFDLNEAPTDFANLERTWLSQLNFPSQTIPNLGNINIEISLREGLSKILKRTGRSSIVVAVESDIPARISGITKQPLYLVVCKDNTAGVITSPFIEKHYKWRYFEFADKFNSVRITESALIDRLSGLHLSRKQYNFDIKYTGVVSAIYSNYFDINLGGEIATGFPIVDGLALYDFVYAEIPSGSNTPRLRGYKPASTANFKIFSKQTTSAQPHARMPKQQKYVKQIILQSFKPAEVIVPTSKQPRNVKQSKPQRSKPSKKPKIQLLQGSPVKVVKFQQLTTFLKFFNLYSSTINAVRIDSFSHDFIKFFWSVVYRALDGSTARPYWQSLWDNHRPLEIVNAGSKEAKAIFVLLELAKSHHLTVVEANRLSEEAGAHLRVKLERRLNDRTD
jgi:hypothetical protein